MAPHETAGVEWEAIRLAGDLMEMPTGSARIMKIEEKIGVWRGQRSMIHDALSARFVMRK